MNCFDIATKTKCFVPVNFVAILPSDALPRVNPNPWYNRAYVKHLPRGCMCNTETRTILLNKNDALIGRGYDVVGFDFQIWHVKPYQYLRREAEPFVPRRRV